MKAGSLVKFKDDSGTTHPVRVGVVVDRIEKKVWRANIHGKKVDWTKVDPEPHAVVMFPHNDGLINIPWVDLEVISESR
tara:strand:- start:3 stop:239 length:237 start_codon:yes stop_codon:yes gene_type:complete